MHSCGLIGFNHIRLYTMELDDLFAEIAPLIVKTSRIPAQEGYKFCNGCKTVKAITDFNNRKARGSADHYGKVSKCRECTTKLSRAWYYEDHEKTKKLARATQYRRRHEGRLTDEEATQLAESNTGICDLCKDPGIVFVDHDHVTGMRRGFLCSRCNFALGGFLDSAELLQKAAAYLIYYRTRLP